MHATVRSIDIELLTEFFEAIAQGTLVPQKGGVEINIRARLISLR